MRYVTLYLCMFLLASCKTKSKQLSESKYPETAIAPDIYLGQADNEWERNVSIYKLNGQFNTYAEGGITYHHYYWSVLDTMVLIDLVFNGGGHGSLTKIYANLAADKYKDVAANDEAFVSLTKEGFRGNKYCSIGKYKKIKQYLDAKFGKPEIKQESSDATHYEYRNPSYTITLECSSFNKPTRGVKSGHYSNATLSMFLNYMK